MTRVGTKELKNRLSFYLRKVRNGDTVLVTDRRVVVAELRRVVRPRDADAAVLDEMAQEGLLSRGTGRYRKARPLRLKGGVLLSDAVLEDRR
jgi:antitoxin (DNA-binding transcriptional repressor) of toxin-antitoxin stability system